VIAVLSGGVGAARFLTGVIEVVDPATVTAIVNVGDDLELHGLSISPDLDTITYTLSGEHDDERGWGLAGETWRAIDSLEQFGAEVWFRLGDRDLGTHLYRTGRLSAGATLSQVSAEIATRFGLGIGLLPVTDDPLRTFLALEDGREVPFQEYFVKLGHSVKVTGVRFAGADVALPAPGVLDLLESATRIVIAPSNPVVSIGPILAVRGVSEVLERRRDSVVAISPIVGGRAIKGPADRLLVELGSEASAVGVAALLSRYVGTFVIDEIDAIAARAVEATGVRCVVTNTVMSGHGVAASLARVALVESAA
jgi:LPPG:FO 2-phospho-L-lactate transferase